MTNLLYNRNRILKMSKKEKNNNFLRIKTYYNIINADKRGVTLLKGNQCKTI